MHALRLLLAFLAVAASPPALSQSCGDTVSGHVVLTADLHCTTGWTALYVGAPGATIDLNGHTLSGDVALSGIALNDAHGTLIRGPGRIEGFWVGVNGVRSNDVRIENVDFVGVDAGVLLNNSDRVHVLGNRFDLLRSHAVSFSHLGWAPGGAVGEHRIADNTVTDSVFGFQLCGAATGNSVIERNTLSGIRDYAIHIEDGSADNRILDNEIADVGNTGIRIAGSSGTQMLGNRLQRGRVGVALLAEQVGACETAGTRAQVRDTVMNGESIFFHDTALVVGLGTGSAPRVLRNRINGNKFYDNTLGIYFLEDAFANDARGNAYQGTTDAVQDFGRGNRW